MNIEPYADDVACAGPTSPKCEQIDELIRLLVTIRHRFGNTSIQYRIQWGSNALWAEDALKRKVDRLQKSVKRLKAKIVLCDRGKDV